MGAVVDMFFLCFSSRTLPSSTCSLCCCACGSRRAKNVASRVCHCHVILCVPMVNTFLPFPSFEASVRCLDNKRLGKQRVEAYQARTRAQPMHGGPSLWWGFLKKTVFVRARLRC
jgi:hypothetical protein